MNNALLPTTQRECVCGVDRLVSPHGNLIFCGLTQLRQNARRNGSCWVISEITISRWRLKWLTLRLKLSNGDYFFAPLLKKVQNDSHIRHVAIMWKQKELLLSCWSSQLCLTSFSCCSKPWRDQKKSRNVKVLIAINKQEMDWDEDTTTRHGPWWIACVCM